MTKHIRTKKAGLFFALLATSFILLTACAKMGDVDQGRVVEFDAIKGIVKIIADKNADPKNPDYSKLPPVTYEMPKDPAEIGPLPKVGKRIKLDTEKMQIIIFDSDAQNLKTIDCNLIDQKENVAADDPLVYDAAARKSISFPIIDETKRTIAIYCKKQKTLTIFSPPDEYLALPHNTWDAGDEVRIYYKEKGKARRFMNISQTDIFKK